MITIALCVVNCEKKNIHDSLQIGFGGGGGGGSEKYSVFRKYATNTFSHIQNIKRPSPFLCLYFRSQFILLGAVQFESP
jgi:hypothetical protein